MTNPMFKQDILDDKPFPTVVFLSSENELKEDIKNNNEQSDPHVISESEKDISNPIIKQDYLINLSDGFNNLAKKYQILGRETENDQKKKEFEQFLAFWKKQKKYCEQTYAEIVTGKDVSTEKFDIKKIDFKKWIGLYGNEPIKNVYDFFESFFYYLYTNNLPKPENQDVKLRIKNIIQITYDIKCVSTNCPYSIDLGLFATVNDIKIYLQNHYEEILLQVDRQYLYLDNGYELSDDAIILEEYLKAFFENIQKSSQEDQKAYGDCLPTIQLQWKIWCIDHIMNYNKSIQDLNTLQDNKQELDLNTPMWKCLFNLYPNRKQDLEDIIKQGKKIRENLLTKYGANFLNYLSVDQFYSIVIYTTDLLYKDLNADFRQGRVNKWKDYARELVLGLRNLPFSWETSQLPKVYRGFNNIDNITKFLESYRIGEIVRFESFTSVTSKEEIAKQNFSGQGAVLYEIETWTGRKIDDFSVFGQEGEMLIAPSTCFTVVNVTKTIQGSYLIKLLESPMPWCEKAVLWVDDQPENNKSLMEDLERRGIMAVPRVSTYDAIYLLNWMGKILHRDFSHFRIVTDMVRKEKSDPNSNLALNYSAGAELIQEIQKLKYDNLVCLYCGDKKYAENNCKILNINMDNVLICTKESDVLDFCQRKLMCVCGEKELKNFIAAQCYSSVGVKCNNCAEYIKLTAVVYHCNIENHISHPNGYNLCLPCANRFIKEKKSPRI